MMSEALALARRIGDLKAPSRLNYNLGLLYSRQSRWEEARRVFETSKEAALAMGWREGMVLNQNELRKVERALAGAG
jgi:uncharacterized protein HemY